MPTIRSEAATILRDAAEAGVVGGSIEDWSGETIYDFNHAVERVAAGVEMARSLPVPFTFTARAENLIRGRNDLDDTIKRLQAFEKAGADVLYAPGLRDLETMRTVVAEVGKPVNVVMSAGDPDLTAEQIAAIGVKRISVGGALSRLALAAFMKGAREMKAGGFTWMRETMPTTDLKKVFGVGDRRRIMTRAACSAMAWRVRRRRRLPARRRRRTGGRPAGRRADSHPGRSRSTR